MKLLRNTTILVFAASSVIAQNDKQASEILKGVSAKYRTYTTVRANFSYVVENPKGAKPEKQTGTLYLKGEKYKLDIVGQEIISDNKTVWTYMKESNEVQLNDPSTNKDAIAPNNIFTMYEKGFYYKFIEETNENGKAVQVIDLTPIDKTRHYFKIRVSIGKADKTVMASKIFDKNGTKSTYTIEKFTANAPLGDDLFSFNKATHPGVEVVDLR